MSRTKRKTPKSTPATTPAVLLSVKQQSFHTAARLYTYVYWLEREVLLTCHFHGDAARGLTQIIGSSACVCSTEGSRNVGQEKRTSTLIYSTGNSYCILFLILLATLIQIPLKHSQMSRSGIVECLPGLNLVGQFCITASLIIVSAARFLLMSSLACSCFYSNRSFTRICIYLLSLFLYYLL